MRVAVTLLAILLGLVVAWAAFQNAGPDPAATDTAAAQPSAQVETPAPTPPAQADAAKAPSAPPASPAPVGPPPAVSASAGGAPDSAPPPAVTALGDLHVVPVASPRAVSIGSSDPESAFNLRVDLVPWGAGVQRIALAKYRADVKGKSPYVIHDTLIAPNPRPGGEPYEVHPFAARSVTINGTVVPLQAVGWQAGRVETTATGSSVEYRVTIADADGQPVAEVVRRYALATDSYDLTLEQQVINRSGQPLRVVWSQNIQGDLTLGDAAYMGDRRMFVAGYFKPTYDPNRTAIYTDGGFLTRAQAADGDPIWPNPGLDPQTQLAWIASENRYFTVVTHAPVPPNATTADVVELERLYPDAGVVAFPKTDVPPDQKAVVFTLGSGAVSVPAGGSAAFPLAVYAGPRQSDILSQPPYGALHLGQLVRYELTCTWFTFQPLAKFLLWFLTTIESVVGDWGIAIVILVAVVRLLLHPITKHAQIGMMKMGKQMQSLQPEIEKLKKKYGEDKQRINQEMMKLYREKGVNPANVLGCLPMFLQTPIWIALYAMLYFAIELRHEPAFYGVFQAISGGHWMFLADLSSPDHFLQFSGGFDVPVPFVNVTMNGINLLPLLMAVVFFLQQRFTTPPPANDQQAQQQKIMRFMVLLFPIFLYSAPSGLTLYILASTTAGVFDSYLVRKHVKEQEAAGTLFDKKPRKPGGLMDRLSTTLQEKQRQVMERQQQAKKPQRSGKRR